MTTPSRSKQAFLERLSKERAQLEALIEQIPVDKRGVTRVADGWSVKDLLAHFLLWEEWVLDRCQELLTTGEVTLDERDTLPTDEMNQLHYERNRLTPVEEVQREEHATFARILTLVQASGDDKLFEAGRYQFLGGIALAEEIENETVSHYRAHREELAELVAMITQAHPGTPIRTDESLQRQREIRGAGYPSQET